MKKTTLVGWWIFLLLGFVNVGMAATVSPLSIDDVLYHQTLYSLMISPDGANAAWVTFAANPGDEQAVQHVFVTNLGSMTTMVPSSRGVAPVWSPDGSKLAFISDESFLRAVAPTQIWITNAAGEKAAPIPGGPTGISTIAWLDNTQMLYLNTAPDGGPSDKLTVGGASAPPMQLFKVNIQTGASVSITDNTQTIKAFSPSPDGNYVLLDQTPEFDDVFGPHVIISNCQLLDLQSLQSRQVFAHAGKMTNYAWTHDSTVLYGAEAVCADPTIPAPMGWKVRRLDAASGTDLEVPLSWPAGLSTEAAPAKISPLADGFITMLANGCNPLIARYTLEDVTWTMNLLGGPTQGHIFNLDVARDNTQVIYEYSSAGQRAQAYWAQLNGPAFENAVPFTNLNLDWADRSLPQTEVFEWTGALGDRVQGLLYYPVNFQPSRRYPLIFSIHGGPNQADFDRWNVSYYRPYQLLAQQGAFVLAPNYHGSTSYGLDFAASIRDGHWVDYPVEDVTRAVSALIDRGLVDENRLGISGISNGAIITHKVIAKDHHFKMAVALSGTSEYVSLWGGEASNNGQALNFYLGSPVLLPQRYLERSPFYQAAGVITPLLMLTGDADTAVSPACGWISFRAYQLYSQAPVRFLSFPGEGHVFNKIESQKRALEEMLAWVQTYLLRPDDTSIAQLPVDSATSSNLTAPGQADWYQFTATAGQFYELALLAQAGFSAELYDATGAMLGRVLPGGNLVWQSPGSGACYVRVQAQGALTGSYELSIWALTVTPTSTTTPTQTPSPTPTLTLVETPHWDPAEFEAFITEMLAQYGVPGAAVSVVQQDQVIFNQGFGVREQGQAKPVDENTLFPIASGTKFFTAALLGVLKDQDKVSWDSPITNYLPDMVFYEPYTTAHCTCRDLLAHRSGLANDGTLLGLLGYTPAEILQRLRFDEPGAEFREKELYSNMGIFVAGEVAARVDSATSWEETITQQLLQPLGMPRSSAYLAGLLLDDNHASGHKGHPGPLTVTLPEQCWLPAAGALISTGSDMTRWMRMLLAEGSLDGSRILESTTVNELYQESIVIKKGDPPAYADAGLYNGLGCTSFQYQGYRVIEKNGAYIGVRSLVTLVPELKVGVTTLANLNRTVFPEAVRAKVLEMFLGPHRRDVQADLWASQPEFDANAADPTPPANPAPVSLPLSAYTGTYTSAYYGPITVNEASGQLHVTAGPRQITGDLLHWDGDQFSLSWTTSTEEHDMITFNVIQGQVTGFTGNQYGAFYKEGFGPTPTPALTLPPTGLPTATPAGTLPPASADLNHDGLVDSHDLLLVEQQWHSVQATPGP